MGGGAHGGTDRPYGGGSSEDGSEPNDRRDEAARAEGPPAAARNAQGPCNPRFPGAAHRDESRARRARAIPRRRDRAPRARRTTLGALVSLSRRPHRQARLPAPHGGLHVLPL